MNYRDFSALILKNLDDKIYDKMEIVSSHMSIKTNKQYNSALTC